METYEIIKDLPFGGTKGRILVKTGNIVTFADSNVKYLLGKDILSDSNFVKKLVPVEGKFKLGTKVCTTVGADRFTPVTVRSYEIKNRIKYAVCTSSTISTKHYKESDLIEYQPYWFINSSGVVCQTLIDKKDSPARVVEFRKKSKNFFETKEECQLALNAIMGH